MGWHLVALIAFWGPDYLFFFFQATGFLRKRLALALEPAMHCQMSNCSSPPSRYRRRGRACRFRLRRRRHNHEAGRITEYRSPGSLGQGEGGGRVVEVWTTAFCCFSRSPCPSIHITLSHPGWYPNKTPVDGRNPELTTPRSTPRIAAV